MHHFKASLINELEKIARRGKTAVFLALTAIIPFAFGALTAYGQSRFGIAVFGGAGYPVEALTWMTSLFLPVLLFMQAADSFSGETADRTLNIALMRPAPRWMLFTAKQLALIVSIGIFLAAAGIGAVLASSLFGLGGLSGGGTAQALLAYAVALLPMTALSAAAVWIGQSFKSGSGALVCVLLLYACAKATALFFPAAAGFTPAAYTDWHLLWLGGVGAEKLGRIFLFLTGCSIVCFTAGFYRFDRKAF